MEARLCTDMYYPRCPVSGTGTSKATRARPVFCGDARALSRISSRRLHCADVLNAAEKHSMFLSVLFGHRHSTCNACYNGRNTLRLERCNICFQGTILMDGASDGCRQSGIPRCGAPPSQLGNHTNLVPVPEGDAEVFAAEGGNTNHVSVLLMVGK